MQITVEIPDDMALEAQARGLNLEHHLPSLLAESLASKDLQEGSARVQTKQERDAAVDQVMRFAAERGLSVRDMDLRAMRHEGHKY